MELRISEIVKAVNTRFSLLIKDGDMTEQAWENLQAHLREIEDVVKLAQEIEKKWRA